MGGWQSYDDDYAPAGAYTGQESGYGSTEGYSPGSNLSGSRSAYAGRDEWTDQSDFATRRGRWSGRGGYGDRMYGDRYYGGSSGGNYGGRSGQGNRDFWDRASDEVSSWFGDEDAERRRRMDQYRGRGPKSYARSDERIKEDVNDRLTDDGYLDATDIDVEVSNREVTLSGEVDSRMAKRRAEDIAESVSGVTHVQNNLRVRQEGRESSSYTGSSTSGTGSTSTRRTSNI
jgi:osmotically-inducible protein OsmY